ncbi:hypothetical protein [Micromonospora globispora]|uniref:hypothetical protein n=1 Tax=Micromonospora globispora TaxID=1450148 RepID=UPI000F5F9551|nr:hypothetical protein [Micromonospora globispora]RQW83555.1 hypothetical protein DKL51_31510 [Micromonospora globispora]
MANLTRAQILARKTGKGTATLPDGSTVAIRALTRDEVLESQEKSSSTAERDNFIVATGMTDPQLSVEDVAAWAASDDAGALVAVSDAIAELSGLKPAANKEATKSTARRR